MYDVVPTPAFARRLPAPAASPHNRRAGLRHAEATMEALSSAVAVLTAMITPAVLISACGALVLSTSTRLGRVVDRVRALIEQFEVLARTHDEDVELFEERRAVIFNQLDKLTTRSRLLQKSLRVFYLALGVFVATSVAIGLVAAVGRPSHAWLPVVLGLSGACGLFYGSVLLIRESRIAQDSLNAEMDFIWKLGRALAPADLRQTRSPHHNPLTLRRRKP
jgi:hypothetical protein